MISPPADVSPPSRLPQVALWCLRVVVFLQCLGIGGRYYLSRHESESDVYGWLFFDHDWPEATAQWIDDAGALSCFAAGWLVLVGGLLASVGGRGRVRGGGAVARAGRILESLAAIVVAGWVLALTTAHMVRGEIYAELALAENAVRYAAPLALLLLCHRGWKSFSAPGRREGIGLLVLACAATFFVHGYKAVQTYGPFTDLILLSDASWWGGLEQAAAERVLVVIGLADMVVALLLVVTRWPAIAIYMTCWGLITAVSRMTALGWAAWPETLIRSANWGAPLVVAIWASRPKARL